jgi:hypothetical protein
MQVEKAQQDKQSAIIRAQGEAASAVLIGQAISSNPAFLALRRIEAARDIANTLSGSANRWGQGQRPLRGCRAAVHENGVTSSSSPPSGSRQKCHVCTCVWFCACARMEMESYACIEPFGSLPRCL